MSSPSTSHVTESVDPFKPGPRDWLSQTAGAAAPSGLEPAAPKLPEQVWTGDRSEASGKRRPAGCSAVHAETSVGATFTWPVRVYWEDTDAGGIVFYANYLKFFERARTEWLRSLGIAQHTLKERSGGMFVVTDTSVRYRQPARLDDQLLVTATLAECGRASMTIAQQAYLKPDVSTLSNEELMSQSKSCETTDTDALLCEGSIRIGWVNAHTLRPGRIPAAVLDALSGKL